MLGVVGGLSTTPSFAARCIAKKGSMRILSSSCFRARPASRFAISLVAMSLRGMCVAWCVAVRGVAWRGVVGAGAGF